MHRALLFQLAAALAAPVPGGLPGVPSTPGVTPVSKVVELLHEMEGKLQEEGAANAKVWHNYTMWNSKEKVEVAEKVQTGTNEVNDLKAFLSDQVQFQDELSTGISDAANEQAAKEAELSNVTGVREGEHQQFLADDEDRAKAIQQVKFATETLEQSAPSFLEQSYVEKLKLTALAQSSEVADLLSQAGSKDEILEIMRKIEEETSSDKERCMNDEQQALGLFEQVKGALDREIAAATELKSAKSQELSLSEEESAAKTKELHDTQEVLRLAEEYAENLRVEFNEKLKEHKEDTRIRSDEIMAVQQAMQILTSQKAQSLFSLVQVPAFSTLPSLSAASAAFIQTELVEAQRSGEGQHGPFDKVKGMVKGMIEKLQKEHSEAASHHEFCTTEMGKTEKQLKKKRSEVTKYTGRLEARQALRAEAEARTTQATSELAEIQSALSAATEIRAEESSVAQRSIVDAKNAVTILKSAMQILSDVFNDDKDAQSERQGQGSVGSQIVGILEVAVSDYEKLKLETESQEQSAQSQFKKLTLETKVRAAALQTELEGLTHRKLNFMSEEQELEREIEAVGNEVAAAEQYMEELKPQCTTKVPSHEERAARRSNEIEGLNNALDVLGGNAVA